MMKNIEPPHEIKIRANTITFDRAHSDSINEQYGENKRKTKDVKKLPISIGKQFR